MGGRVPLSPLQFKYWSSEIFERGTFCGAKILQISRSKTVALVLALNQDFAIGRGFNLPPKGMRNKQTSVSQTYHKRGSKEAMGGLGAKLPAAGQFFVIFWEKQAILMPLDHNLHVFRTRALLSRDISWSRDSLETLFFKVLVSSRSRRSKASVSSRSRLGLVSVSSRSRLGLVSVSSRSRLGLVSVSSRSRLGLVSVSSRSRLGLVSVSSRSRLGLVSVSSRSRLVSVSSRSRLGLVSVSSRSRLGLVSVSSRSRLGTSKSRKMGKSRPYFQSERKNPQ